MSTQDHRCEYWPPLKRKFLKVYEIETVGPRPEYELWKTVSQSLVLVQRHCVDYVIIISGLACTSTLQDVRGGTITKSDFRLLYSANQKVMAVINTTIKSIPVGTMAFICDNSRWVSELEGGLQLHGEVEKPWFGWETGVFDLISSGSSLTSVLERKELVDQEIEERYPSRDGNWVRWVGSYGRNRGTRQNSN